MKKFLVKLELPNGKIFETYFFGQSSQLVREFVLGEYTNSRMISQPKEVTNE